MKNIIFSRTSQHSVVGKNLIKKPTMGKQRLISILCCMIILSFLLSVPVNAQLTDIPLVERNALIDLYNNTDGDNWSNNTNWLGEPGTECDWYGVSCDTEENHVTIINLAYNNLAGTIPESIGNFKKFRILHLFGNHLAGNISSELGKHRNLQKIGLFSGGMSDIKEHAGNYEKPDKGLSGISKPSENVRHSKQKQEKPFINTKAQNSLDIPDIYVDAAYTGTETGEADTPFNTIGEAVRNADTDEIIAVARGLYTETVTIANIAGLKLEGGWINNMGTWERNDSPEPGQTTIMPSDGVAVYLDNAPGSVIEGFVLQKGIYSLHSDNILLTNTIAIGLSPVRIKDSNGVRIVSNEIIGTSSDNPGYGLIVENSTVETNGNLIHADFGINYNDSDGSVSHNSVYIRNTADTALVGIKISSGGNVRIENNVILNNLFLRDKDTAFYSSKKDENSIADFQYLNDETSNVLKQGGNVCHSVIKPNTLYIQKGGPRVEVVYIPRPTKIRYE